ncbi:MAG: hypothetical protein ACP5VE_01685 [Chthonomonadales bacterium]
MNKSVSPIAALLVIVAAVAVVAVLYLFVFTGKQPGAIGGPPHAAVRPPAPTHK